MSKNALIGYTGTIGKTLLEQLEFDDTYNSENIQSISGKSYSSLICAGLPAEKWKANKFPEVDEQNTLSLIKNLSNVSAERFILISTVDVYSDISNSDENSEIIESSLHAYGRNRFNFENYIRHNFNHNILRIGGLVGKNIKKNILYDIKNFNMLENINKLDSFQYYPLDNLWNDIKVVIKNGLDLVNFTSEPIETSILIDKYVEDNHDIKNKRNIKYDIRSINSDLFYGNKNYLYNREQILNKIDEYLKL